MKADLKSLSGGEQALESRAASNHIVLGMYLEPGFTGPQRQGVSEVFRFQADAGRGRQIGETHEGSGVVGVQR